MAGTQSYEGGSSMQRIIPLFLILLVLTGCTASVQQRAEYRQIGIDEAVTMMEEEADYIITNNLCWKNTKTKEYGC